MTQEQFEQEMKSFTKEAYLRLKYLIEKGDEDYRNIYLVCSWLEQTEKKLKTIHTESLHPIV